MDYNDFIMNLLEERGLDKRFRDNPEAVSQICSLVIRDVEQKNGKPLRSSGIDEIQNAAKIVLDGSDLVRNDGVRVDNFYSILEDGSLSVKHKTDVRPSSVGVSKANSEHIFSIGKEKGDFIVTENSDYLSQVTDFNNPSSFATASVKFSIYNKHGLEIQEREISQDVSVNTIERISSSMDAFRAIGRPGVQHDLSPLSETVLTRGTDLATEMYSVQKTDGGRIFAFEKGRIISENRKQDAIFNPIPINQSLGGNISEPVKIGTMPNFPPEYEPGHLRGYTDYMAKSYEQQTTEEKQKAIQLVYKQSAEKSLAFRETLFESAKTNPQLQTVLEQLDLVRTTTKEEAGCMAALQIVYMKDLLTLYRNASGEEMRNMAKKIIDQSIRANHPTEKTDDNTK